MALELQEKMKGGDSSATTSPLQVKSFIPFVLKEKISKKFPSYMT